MWQAHDARGLAALHGLGVNAAAITAVRGTMAPNAFDQALAPLLQTQTPFYVENIATDFYASYHRWQPGHSVTWRFQAVQQAYRANPADPAILLREPSLSDPAWQDRINARLAAHVTALQRYQPLFYNLGDETGIADLAAPWDFDFGPQSLAGLRAWLRTQYPSLAALNAEWGTHFTDWQNITPITTDAAIAGGDGDAARWSDFKAWMDIAFARAITAGADAVRKASPAARAGLEGGQPPGWGGYDYSLLAPAMDVMEIYDLGNSLEIAKALNPRLTTLTTLFGAGPTAIHRLWHAALAGTGGVIIWDDSHSIITADDTPGPRGRDLAPMFEALRHGPGARLVAATPQRDPVAILYSQASFRADWLLARKAEKASWTIHDSGWEDEHDNPWRAATSAAFTALGHAQITPDVLSTAMVEAGALRHTALKMLLLPRTLALSDQAIAELAAFTAHGGIVLADTPPGRFDAHGRPRTALPQTTARFVGAFTSPSLATALRGAGITAPFTITTAGQPAADVQSHRWQLGGITLLALERDVPAAGLPAPAEAARLTLAHPGFIYDLNTLHVLAHGASLGLSLDATSPTLLAIAPAALPLCAANVPESELCARGG